MRRTAWGPLLERARILATEFLEGLPERPVGPRAGDVRRSTEAIARAHRAPA